MTSFQSILTLFFKKRGVYILQLTLTVLIFGVAVNQVKDLFSSQEVVQIITTGFNHRPFLIVLMTLISGINWGIEAIKWLVVLPKDNKVNFLQAYRSVLVGLGMSLLMPRLAGESIGRYTSHEGEKKDVVSALFLTKVAQTIITFFFGIIGVYYFKSILFSWIDVPSYWVLFLFLLLFSVVFFLRKMIIDFVLTSVYFESFRQINRRKGVILLMFSFLRYLTFFIQFYIMVLFVDTIVEPFELFFGLSALYFLRMGTISINLVIDLSVRFATGLLVFTALGLLADVDVVIAIFSLVWLFNVVFPSLIGGLLILKKK